MTRRQKTHLDFIIEWWKLYGYGPSYRDIADRLGGGLANTHRIVGVLEADGYLKILRNRARGIYPTSKTLGFTDVPGFIQSSNKKQN